MGIIRAVLGILGVSYISLAMLGYDRPLIRAVMGFEDTTQSGVPSNFIPKFKTTATGYDIRPDILISNHSDPVWVQNAVSGYKRPHGLEKPGKVEFLTSISGCKVTKPSANEFFASAQVRNSWLTSGIFAISEEKLEKYASAYAKSNIPWTDEMLKKRVRAGHVIDVVDVVVMETEKPVYLVLASEADVVWNVQKSPSSAISRVVLLGEGASGVVNLDPEIPVEVLAGKQMAACGGQIAREPKPHWPIMKSLTGTSKSDERRRRMINIYRARYDRYSTWFENIFGVPVSANQTVVNSANHFLVGELPENASMRAPYQSIEGQHVRLFSEDNILITNWKGMNEFQYQKVVQLGEERRGNK